MSVGEVRAAVIARDGGCIAPRLDPDAGECRDQWGLPMGRNPFATSLEVDRVRDAPMMGKAPSHEDASRMVTLCPGHHRGTGASGGRVWATANRERIRAYLARFREGEHDGDPTDMADGSPRVG